MSDVPPVNASSSTDTNAQNSAPDAAAFEAAALEQAGMMGVMFIYDQSTQMMNNMKPDDDECQQS